MKIGTEWNREAVIANLQHESGLLITESNNGIRGYVGGAGDDELYGSDYGDEFGGGAGNDLMVGGLGGDWYFVRDAGDRVVEDADGGDDLVIADISYVLPDNVENLTLYDSTYWANSINATGNLLDNYIYGNRADNVIDGGGGIDDMSGGSGNDTYFVDNIADRVNESEDDGNDTVIASVTWTLGTDVENLTLSGIAAINATGNSLGNVLTGNAGNNTLNGGTGADSMSGGAGNDIYTVDNTADVVIENANEGTDLVNASASFTLSVNVENLTLMGTAAISGTGNSGNNVLTGNSAANMLNGGAGDDTLDGKAGVDTLTGGAGNDSYVVDNTADVITELANEGTDSVSASVTYTLSVNVENLTLTGTSAINGNGNSLDNLLTGNSGVNVLTGGAGNDTYVVGTGDSVIEAVGGGTDTVKSSVTWALVAEVENLTLTGTSAISGTGNAMNNVLVGNTGNNTLNGAAGSDAMAGGAGNDTYVVDNIADTVTENANEGTDLVQASISYALSANVENLTLTGTAAINGTGNAVNNTINGNSGSNVLDGGVGADTLVGGAGNDTYYVDNASDVTTEASSAGTDMVIASVNWTLAANVENLTLAGTSAINGTGNTLANTINGNSADNVLDGGAGTDTLIGGAGNDTYILNVATDIVTENANEGTDTVKIGVTYTLGANVENLTLTGTSAVNGTGNALSNVLTGNSAVNTLTGGAGNDTLDGAAGTDILVGGTGNDTYWLGRGYGADSATENDATAGNTDVARFDVTVSNDQLWFVKNGNNLEVSIIGTSDKLTLNNWYLGNQYHVEQFKTSNGKTLLDSQVQNLVGAMAAFSPPAAGQTTLPSSYATSLSTVIAANWQ